MRRLAAVLPCLLALLAAAPAPAHDVLPDLDQIAPSDLSVRTKVVNGRRVFRLGFASASANVGPGDLTIHGYRTSRAVATMQVDQLVDQSEGTAQLVRNIGAMRFIVHPDHRHWHLLGFERYQLRHRGRLVAKDHKSGFCLGDRYAIPQADKLEGFNPTPLQGDTCGLKQPGLLGLFAGISTGWADRYEAHIEGQYIDVTGMPGGQYVLTHAVNLERRILESNYANNASSVRFLLTWRRDRAKPPFLRVLRLCPGSAVCP
jgi:hypothetical protein